MIPNTIALEEYLKPLNTFIMDDEVSEILINQHFVVFIEKKGFFQKHHNDLITMRHLMCLANLVARYSDQRLSEKEPLLSGQLPSGHRIQIILPPATEQNRVVISIRKQTISNVTLDYYESINAFSNTKISNLKTLRNQKANRDDSGLNELLQTRKFTDFIKKAVENKKNILISGATSTGKTTFLNACLQAIHIDEHLVTLEDVPELKPTHPLHTPLFTSKGLQGIANVTMQDLVQASLRIRPDRIIMGELRGAEASDFIHATATGHDGSISSVHASSPYVAFMRLVHMVKLGGTNLSRDDILEDLHTVVDIIIQLRRRVEGNHCIREVSEIYYADARDE